MTGGTVTSLLDLCLDSSLKYLESSSSTQTKEFVYLPENVWQALISRMIQEGKCNDAFLSTFSNLLKSTRGRVRLQNAQITDRGIDCICYQLLRDVNLAGCSELTHKSLEHLSRCKNSLMSLNIAGCHGIRKFNHVALLSNLRVLDLSRTDFDQENFSAIGTSLTELRVLNLKETKITDLGPVSALKNLASLDVSCCKYITCLEPLEQIQGYIFIYWFLLYQTSE